ncbi:helix-turn-helix domain-containing protein [Larkinella soli]|uniref:helix-turn-helix domain-containing protein n=1 Tax=Larkinella soli TaxID=1770527 RepID=UPI001E5676A5|nr:helix-turn-helix domain-containing protein [Larkinella soli]
MTEPEIIEILAVEPYRIITRWSNGEIRRNDYTARMDEWKRSSNPLYSRLSEWELFSRVTLRDGVLSWPEIRVEFNLGGRQRSEPLEFDSITTFQESVLMADPLTVSESIGESILKARKAANITQEDLARRIGSTKQYVSKVERNMVSPKAETLRRMAAAMGKRIILM